ncbi:heavy metal-associated isoprenylated plant protein 19-like [Punica granatum]|nr:heavy metal-associated isoprenylated plant protein 19-like [Punica granatum]
MHCNACERSVAKIIAKIEGVETFKTDMNRHIVEVTGTMDPQKVLKKLKKRTGKRVEMLGKKDDSDTSKDEHDKSGGNLEQIFMIAHQEDANSKSKFDYCCVENETLMMFSDENPNACCLT